MASWNLGFVIAVLWPLAACGLVLDTAPPTGGGDGALDGGSPRDAMRRDSGRHDSGQRDSAVGDATVPPPPTDSGPVDCATDTDCDDENACTEDLCLPSGCEHAPLDVACDDGVFCNGPDRCSAGTCSLHDGDICVPGTVCSEALATCTGCATDSDCPVPVVGPWTMCRGFADTCGEEGTRTRAITTFYCDGGMCARSDNPVSELCGRSTDGDLCLPANFTDWGACIGASDCSGSGIEERTKTEGFCADGLCGLVTVPETRSCVRPVAGAPCSDGMCGTGACTGPDTCSIMATTCGLGEMCCGVGGICARPGFC